MSTAITVKRHNHRAHPCDTARKMELLNFLLSQNADKSILIVTAKDPSALQSTITADNVSVANDTALAESPELRAEMLISFDLPENAADYQTRLTRADSYALVLLDEEDQKQLYPIETLLGRIIMQEMIEAFKPAATIAAEQEAERLRLAKEAKFDRKPRQDTKKPDRQRDERAPRSDRPARDDRKPRSDRPARDDRAPRYERDDKRPARSPAGGKDGAKSSSWGNKEKPNGTYMGKDENGKPIFSGKSRERNHRHDGTPKEGTYKPAPKRDGEKPKFAGSDEKKRYDKPRSSEGQKRDGEKPKFAGSDEKKRYDKPRSSEGQKRDGEQGKKPYGDREQRKPYGDGSKKPYKKEYSHGDSKKPVANAAPKRAPKKIKIPSSKLPKESK